MQPLPGLGASVHIVHLSPVGNLHQVLVLGVYHTSMGDGKQIPVQMGVRAQEACCLVSLEKLLFLSGIADTFCLLCMPSAPVRVFNFGSTGGETILNAPVRVLSADQAANLDVSCLLCTFPTMSCLLYFSYKSLRSLVL